MILRNALSSLYLQTEDKLPTATPASKLAAKAAAVPSSSNIKDTIPETPVGKTKEETSKKVKSPTKEDKIIKKESPMKKSPKLSTDNDVPDQVPPSLEKKKSNYRSFMARDGPRALGTKPIPEVKLCLHFCSNIVLPYLSFDFGSVIAHISPCIVVDVVHVLYTVHVQYVYCTLSAHIIFFPCSQLLLLAGVCESLKSELNCFHWGDIKS